MILDVKDSVGKSIEYLKKFFPSAEKIQIEEIEITDDDKH